MAAKRRQASSGLASRLVRNLRRNDALGVTLGDVVGLLVCNPVHAESFFFLEGRKVATNNLMVLKTATSFTSKI